MTEPKPHRRWGYFLLGMLAAGVIITPIYQRYENGRLKSVCLSNLRQLGISELQYVRDYDECWPPAAQSSDALAPYMTHGPYYDPGKPTAKGLDVFGCPAAKGTRYAMNAHIAGGCLGDLPDSTFPPDRFESTTRLDNYVDLGESAPQQSRHGEGTAVVFVDGHVRLVKTVDCSFIIDPAIHLGGARYPIRTLPSVKAPLPANMQAVFAKNIIKLPENCAVTYSNEIIDLFPKWTRRLSHEDARKAMKAIYPTWKFYRKAAKVKSDGGYWVVVRWDDSGRKTDRFDISRL
ncbi:MAG TPA: hypothetical protein VGK19_14515 [Capsulimonadaceae bacterium]|jgi:prepilin-type processing-associated H-X9-DG protein